MSWSSTLSRKFSISSFSLASTNTSLASRNSNSNSSKDPAKVTEFGTSPASGTLDEASIKPVYYIDDAENPFGDQHAVNPQSAQSAISSLASKSSKLPALPLLHPPPFPSDYNAFSNLSHTPPLQTFTRKSTKLVRKGGNGKSSKKIGGKSLRGLKKVASLVFGTTYSLKASRADDKSKGKGKANVFWEAEVGQDVDEGKWEKEERRLQDRYLEGIRSSLVEETELIITNTPEAISRPVSVLRHRLTPSQSSSNRVILPSPHSAKKLIHRKRPITRKTSTTFWSDASPLPATHTLPPLPPLPTTYSRSRSQTPKRKYDKRRSLLRGQPTTPSGSSSTGSCHANTPTRFDFGDFEVELNSLSSTSKSHTRQRKDSSGSQSIRSNPEIEGENLARRPSPSLVHSPVRQPLSPVKLKLSPNVTVRRTRSHEAPDRLSEIPCDESDSDFEEESGRFFADEGSRSFMVALDSDEEDEEGRYQDADAEEDSPSKSEGNAPFSTRTPVSKKVKPTQSPFSTPNSLGDTSYDSIKVGIPRIIGLFQSPTSLPTPSRLTSRSRAQTNIPSALSSSSTFSPRRPLPSVPFTKTTSFPSRIPLPSTPSIPGKWPAARGAVGRN